MYPYIAIMIILAMVCSVIYSYIPVQVYIIIHVHISQFSLYIITHVHTHKPTLHDKFSRDIEDVYNISYV